MSNTRESTDAQLQPMQLAGARDAVGERPVDASQLALPLPTGNPVMKAAEAIEVNEDTHAFDADSAASIHLQDTADAPFGQRLCAAREMRGWSRADVAARLKLPAQLIARLEADNYAGLTEGVFLRGYLGSYARLVGVPIDHANRIAAAHTQAAPLIATGTISRSRYLFERYSVSATYLVLTAIIVVPAVWLATHGGLEQNLARTTPLDPPAQIAAAAPTQDASISAVDTHNAAQDTQASVTPAAVPAATSAVPSTQVDQSPIIASMAPFTAAPTAPSSLASANVPTQAASATGSGAHTLTLKLNEQSWVEVTAADGRKLEYGMLAANSEHNYRSDGPVSVRIGNAQGAQLRADGEAIDLAPYQRSNVASIKVFTGTGSGATRTDQ